jgi:glutathione S-transferase
VHNETSPPDISESGRGRCRTAGRVALHLGASLSDAAIPDHHFDDYRGMVDILGRLMGQCLSERAVLRQMQVTVIELYQFPFSHFCEKARWALDYKSIAYRAVNLLPGFHMTAVRKLAPKTCLPVLRDEKTVVQDSTAIIDYLETKYSIPRLTPQNPKAAREALEWEQYFNEEIGVTSRLWFYYHILPDRHLALSFLLQRAAWHKRPLFLLVYPKVRQAMMQFMHITGESAKQAEERLRAALERLDGALDGCRFLVEDRFSRADLTACALLSPYCLPDDIEASARFPAAMLSLRDELKSRRFYQWVRSVYTGYRQPLREDGHHRPKSLG